MKLTRLQADPRSFLRPEVLVYSVTTPYGDEGHRAVAVHGGALAPESGRARDAVPAAAAAAIAAAVIAAADQNPHHDAPLKAYGDRRERNKGRRRRRRRARRCSAGVPRRRGTSRARIDHPCAHLPFRPHPVRA